MIRPDFFCATRIYRQAGRLHDLIALRKPASAVMEHAIAMVLATIALPPAGDMKIQGGFCPGFPLPIVKNTDGPKRYGDLKRPR
jgi:hypothetical protein